MSDTSDFERVEALVERVDGGLFQLEGQKEALVPVIGEVIEALDRRVFVGEWGLRPKLQEIRTAAEVNFQTIEPDATEREVGIFNDGVFVGLVSHELTTPEANVSSNPSEEEWEKLKDGIRNHLFSTSTLSGYLKANPHARSFFESVRDMIIEFDYGIGRKEADAAARLVARFAVSAILADRHILTTPDTEPTQPSPAALDETAANRGIQRNGAVTK